MSTVVLDHVTKNYGNFTAVADLDLEIESGSLVALLGPSGCGKTTCLRMLGGFIAPTRGTIRINGEDVSRLPPHKRNTAMVFQSYALFPHLNVENNVAYGLKRRGLPKEEIARRVADVLSLVRIGDLARRYPNALSGGQKQRVAVARALVLRPDVLLLDEPFSALDAQVRESTRLELRRIQQETGITALLVTHDQIEAMSIADKVVVMNRGHIEQVGTPHEIYDQPASRFAAEFIGSANVIPGHVRAVEGGKVLFDSEIGVRFAADIRGGTPAAGKGHVVIRGEDIRLSPVETGGDAVNSCHGTVAVSSFLGTMSEIVARLPSGMEVRVRGDRALSGQHRVGDEIRLHWTSADVRVVA